MKFTDLLGFILSILGAYSLVLYLRFLLPRNLIPLVSARLDEVEAILDRAVAEALPNANEYRIDVAMCFTVVPVVGDSLTLHSLRNQLLRFRTASHRSPWFWQQLGLFILSGLTCRVYTHHLRIAELQRGLEVRKIVWSHASSQN